ncbi:MAG: nuclear transport factor 2 family protein [Bacteroidales bacterium]
MRTRLFYLFLAWCLVTTACKPSDKTMTDAQKASIEKQVSEQWAKISESVEKSDGEAFSSFLSNTGFLSMSSQGTAFNSRQEYADTVTFWFKQRKGAEIKDPMVKISVLSKRFALLNQQSVLIATFKDDKVMSIHHTVSFLFKKEESGWMIIHGHESWYPL